MSPVYPERKTVHLDRNAIRAIIEKTGVPHAQIAASCHISYTTLRRAMRGGSITLETAGLIGAGLKMRISELWPELKK